GRRRGRRPDPVVRHALPGRQVRGRPHGDRPRRAPLRGDRLRGLPGARRPLQVPPARDLREQARLRALLAGRGVRLVARGLHELVPGPGHLRVPRPRDPRDARRRAVGRRRALRCPL
ncbi:MAG: hypothetical protein AVDCRST_MAG30-4220, partial [uncultured Solirubrobacteraceae bacterium]